MSQEPAQSFVIINRNGAYRDIGGFQIFGAANGLLKWNKEIWELFKAIATVFRILIRMKGFLPSQGVPAFFILSK